MGRRRYHDDSGDWEDRWRDQTDEHIADLQRAVGEAAQTMVEIREWIRNHDSRHNDERQARQQLPGDIRGWISTAISLFTLLLMLYLQQNH